ncbi:MAG TPA: UGSC family (seleno)protein [Xanthobacteraceae bacterium]|nr:UGSC family (seleno)protein [Xanthobacteraceae bacterium]
MPTIAVHTHVFHRVAKSTARLRGIPNLRQAFVPQPVVGRTPAELRAYIEGDDAISHRRFMEEVIEGLTRPLDDADLSGATFERTTPRLVPPDTRENLEKLFLDNRWTDFMPIVLPTQERVAAMLRGTSQPPDKVVGRMRAGNFRESWEYTVEKVAVNAVMAGARPEYFPAILALAASNQTSRQGSTTSQTCFSVVNGPIRNELGMNAGIGAMGPYNHANTAIGRAYSLLSQNGQGGSVPGETYMGALGNPLAYSLCFPENEERSPWVPLHVQKGFKPTDSTVSVFVGNRGIQEGFGPRDTWEAKFRRCLAATSHIPPCVIVDPIVARLFAARGINSKDDLINWCARNARVTARDYWDDQWIQTLVRPRAVAGVEPYATRLKAAPDDIIEMYDASQINAVVVGGETQGAWKIFSAHYVTTVSVDAWR